MGFVYKASMSCRGVGSYEHSQAPEQKALDLYNVPLTQLELVWSRWTVVDHSYA